MQRFWMCRGTLVLTVAWLVSGGGCSNDESSIAGEGGAGALVPSANLSVTTGPPGTGGVPACDGAPDGVCETVLGEDCSCPDCVETGMCVPGACVTEDGGFCDPDLDSCLCEDCDHDYFCGDPADQNCTPGVCDGQTAGCNCEDCWTDPACADNVAACEGESPDRVCNRPDDGCACPDCLGAVGCDPCVVDDFCAYRESCHCVDCLEDAWCNDPGHCVDDSICAPMYEGCQCDDCKNAPACGGQGSGGMGGTGGAAGGVAGGGN
jgi:hypothetical protein